MDATWELVIDAPVGRDHPMHQTTEVLFELTATSSGNGTRLRMRSSGLSSESQRAGFAQGWDFYLPRLQLVASGAPVEQDVFAPDRGAS